jgi:hypothetical protein
MTNNVPPVDGPSDHSGEIHSNASIISNSRKEHFVNHAPTDNEKVIIFRLERVLLKNNDRKDNDKLDYSSVVAVDDVFRAILHHHKNLGILLSIDETEEMKPCDAFSDQVPVLVIRPNYVKCWDVEISTGNRYRKVVVFKLKTSLTFREVKYTDTVMAALTKWKWSMNHHRLCVDQGNTHLIYNLFHIHPSYVNKTILARNIHNVLKQYIKQHLSLRERDEIGIDVCAWILSTKDAVVEVGVRKWNAEYTNGTGKRIEVNTEVLTIRVERQYVPTIKNLINRIAWNEKEMGLLVEENPELNNLWRRIMLVYMQNKLCSETAYVHLSWMPSRMWKVRLPDHDNATIKDILLGATVELVDGTKAQLFRSINLIKESTGLYYLITTKELLHKAETFATDLMKKVNRTKEYKDDDTLVNPEKYSIRVGRKTDWNNRSRRNQNDRTELPQHEKYSSREQHTRRDGMEKELGHRHRSVKGKRNKLPNNTSTISNENSVSETSTPDTTPPTTTIVSFNNITTNTQTSDIVEQTQVTDLEPSNCEENTSQSTSNEANLIEVPEVNRTTDVVRRLERLEADFDDISMKLEECKLQVRLMEEIKAQNNQLLLLVKEQSALLNEHGLTLPDTSCVTIASSNDCDETPTPENINQRGTISTSDRPIQYQPEMDERTVRVRNPRSKT